MDLGSDLNRMVARRFGVVTRQSLLTHGMSASGVDRRLRSGLLVPVHPGVFRHAAVAPSRHQTLLAAVLAAGPSAVASHRSAAWLHGLRRRPSARPEILVPGDRHRRLQGVTVHRTDTLDLVDCSSIGAIPTTTPARALLDEGAVLPVRLVEADLEAALLDRRCDLADLWDVLNRLGGHGRPGTGVLRRLLEARGPSTPALESALELALLHLLRRCGFPEPMRQHAVTLALGRTVRLDFAWPELRIGIEAEGRRWHTGTAFERDLARRNALTETGWLLFHYGWTAVRATPERVAAELWRARHLAAAA